MTHFDTFLLHHAPALNLSEIERRAELPKGGPLVKHLRYLRGESFGQKLPEQHIPAVVRELEKITRGVIELQNPPPAGAIPDETL